jgi:hypothetical protein
MHGSFVSYQPIDRLGALASTACSVHCVLTAVLPGAIGAIGSGSALLGDELEWGFTLAALSFAVLALVLGWRKHRSLRVVSTLGAGIGVLLLARLLEGWVSEPVGIALSVVAGLTLVVGHGSNIRASLPVGRAGR